MLAALAVGREGEISAITDAGMAGEIDFRTSMEQRLQIAQPSRALVEAFGRDAPRHLVPGMDAVVAGLPAECWIVSGGLQEALLETARRLKVHKKRVLGTQVEWDHAGRFVRLQRCGSKPDAVRDVYEKWDHPRIAVGDGMSDYALLEEGCVDHFVAFTGVVRREPVVATGCPEARTVEELDTILQQLL